MFTYFCMSAYVCVCVVLYNQIFSRSATTSFTKYLIFSFFILIAGNNEDDEQTVRYRSKSNVSQPSYVYFLYNLKIIYM